VAQHEQALRVAQEEHESALADVQAQHEKLLKAVKDEREATLAEAHARHEQALRAAQEQREAAVAEAEAQHETALQSLQSEHKAALVEARAHHEKALETHQSDREAAVAQAQAQHEKALQSLQSEHEAALAKARSQHEQALRSHQSEREAAVAQAQAQYDDSLKALKDAHEKAMAAEREQHASVLAAVQTEAEAQRSAWEAARVSETATSEHTAEREARLEALARELAEAKDAHSALERALAAATATHADEIAALHAKHATAWEAAEHAHAERREALHDAEGRLQILTSKVAEAQVALTELRTAAAEHRAAAEQARAERDQTQEDGERLAEQMARQAAEDRTNHYVAITAELRKQLALKDAEMAAMVRTKQHDAREPLMAELTAAHEERDALQARVAELQDELARARAPEAPATPPRSMPLAPALSWTGSAEPPVASPSLTTTTLSTYASPPGSTRRGPMSLRSDANDDHGEVDVPAWVGAVAAPVALPTHMQNIDPEVANAIIECMRGEWLYKYAPHFLSAVERRHRRFFFINPFNRTIQWTAEEPRRTAGHVAKAKNAFIDEVALMDDHHAHPAGLYYQTIVIRSGHKELKITAPNKVRHRVWCTALGYLLQSNDSPVISAGTGSSKVSIPLEMGGRGSGSLAGSTARLQRSFSKLSSARTPGSMRKSQFAVLSAAPDQGPGQRAEGPRSSRRSNPDKRVLSGSGATPAVPAAGITGAMSAVDAAIHQLPPASQAQPTLSTVSSRTSARKSWWFA